MDYRLELIAKYTRLARVAFHIHSGAEYKALHRIVMSLTTKDPLTHLLAAKAQAELDMIAKPEKADKYLRKIKLYEAAIDDLAKE